MNKTPLTVRQHLFVQAYLADVAHSGRGAAIAAGYAERRAHVTACQLLRKPHVRAAVDRALRPQLRKYGLTRARVLRELATVAFSDIMDYAIGDTGHVALAGGAAKRATRALASIKRKRRETVRGHGDAAMTEVEHETEIRLWDKGRALVLAMKYLGLLIQRVEVIEPEPRPSDDEIRQSILRKLLRIKNSGAADGCQQSVSANGAARGS